MGTFSVKECSDHGLVRELFQEYAAMKGAESCFLSFEKEISDLGAFYSGGALLVGYEEEAPAGCIAIKRIDNDHCEAKRLYIRPAYRGKRYARHMLGAMLEKAGELGFREVSLTTKPSVMQIAYGLYGRMGFRQLSEEDGIVEMAKSIREV